MYSNRKIDLQPDPGLEEREYLNDVERYGKDVADAQKDLFENICSENETKKETLQEILNTHYIYDFDESKNEALFFLPEKDEQGNIIVDKEKKCIKFIDKGSGKTIVKCFE